MEKSEGSGRVKGRIRGRYGRGRYGRERYRTMHIVLRVER